MLPIMTPVMLVVIFSQTLTCVLPGLLEQLFVTTLHEMFRVRHYGNKS